LIFPTLIVSILIGLIGVSMSDSFSLKGVGLAYILMSLFFHYFIYEIRNPNEYYFYYNFGLSKIYLWACTLIISLFVGLIMIVL